MKLNEIVRREKATSIDDLIASIKNGRFTKDGSHLKTSQLFSIYDKKMISLEGCPNISNGKFYCGKNKLTSLKNIHKYIKKMDGGFYANFNPIKSHVLGLLKIPGCTKVEMDNHKVAKIINKYLPLGDLLDCQEELIEAGFEEYAQL